jgi:hypothetical protein
MWIQAFIDSLTATSARRRPIRRSAPVSRLCFEALEDRTVPAFLAPVSYDVGTTGPQAVVSADFDGDGLPDLAAVQYSESNVDNSAVKVLLGNADGTFRPALHSPTGKYPQSLAFGDFDGDGNLDLATANASDVSVLRGNGDGTFQAPSNFGIGSNPSSVAAGDFNGDGLLDLGVTSNIYDGYTGLYGYANVLLGNGGGGFSGPYVQSLGWGFHTSAVVVDLNGDGFGDFVAASRGYGKVYVMLGDGTGDLRDPSGFTCGNSPVSVAVGDVNGDTVTDLVTANWLGDDVGVLLGDGLGNFSAVRNFATGLVPTAVVLGDFTGDGHVDVATANSNSDDLSLLRGRGDGTFSSAVNSAVGFYPWGAAAGDFNGDGWLDAVTANVGGNDVSVLINDHSWPPEGVPAVSISDVMVTEGNIGSVNATFTVSLSAAYGQPVTVAYATANGTATAGSDYLAVAGTLIFAPGETSKTVTVLVKGDRLFEPHETFFVSLSGATGAIIVDRQAVGTILDDEPRISITDVSKKEGKKNQTTQFTFTVTLSAGSDQPVTMSFQTVNGTATTAGNDYVAKTGTLTFAPGQTTKTITIEVKGDSKKEASETFYLELFGLSGNASFTKNRGLGTILNDD